MTPQLDEILDTLSLEARLEIVRRLRVGSLTLRDGDRVKADRRLYGSYLDQDLEAEGQGLPRTVRTATEVTCGSH
ncbi:hypothetical protein [Streptomyces sennicomposti]|uniref:hypothetical protein n=1 Tax=Streptomyces sennicomposti TaxID=2873384 RepID=UPI001CA68C96|nr:hypothetical protein [Streptomyces sennicomposti]MBY8868718.1 hypothetical protein [Streptomyces sennicomposti]